VRVFLTGGSGFLGAATAKVLVQRGHQVVASVRVGSARAHLDALGIEVVEGALDDPVFLAESMKGCMGLMHIAGAAGRYYPQPDHYQRVNVDLTRSVFTAARGAGVSQAVYCGTVVIPQGLHSPYADSKRRGARAAIEIGGAEMRVCVVHPSGMVGPEDRAPTPMGRGLIALADGRTRVSLGGGGGFVHVSDSAEMHVVALEHGEKNREYVANAEYWTIRELFGLLSKSFSVPPPRLYVPEVLARSIAFTAEWVGRLLGKTPPVTRFAVTYLYQPAETDPDGKEDRLALGLGPYRSIVQGCVECVHWSRSES
jgi:dihydroflavonol-4-reductase